MSGVDFGSGGLHCNVEDIAAVLEKRLQGKLKPLQTAVNALKAGASAGTTA
jgi:hypothetical protein